MQALWTQELHGSWPGCPAGHHLQGDVRCLHLQSGNLRWQSGYLGRSGGALEGEGKNGEYT